MSMPYAHKHSGIFDVPAGFAEPNLLPYHDRELAQANEVFVSGNTRDGNRQQTLYVYGKMRNAESPISPLSPPQSSAGSVRLSNSSCDYHYDSDSHKSDNSNQSCSSSQHTVSYRHNESPHEGAYYQGTQASAPSVESVFRYSPEGLQPYLRESCVMPCADNSGPYSDNAVSVDRSMKNQLHELETALMGPDSDETDFSGFVGQGSVSSAGSWTDLLEELRKNTQHLPSSVTEEDRARYAALLQTDNVQQMRVAIPNIQNLIMSDRASGRQGAVQEVPHQSPCFQPFGQVMNRGCPVKSLLLSCAAAIVEGREDLINLRMDKLKNSVSVFGDPIQRLAAYMYEGLVARLANSGSSIYKILKCQEASAKDVLSAMQKLYEICPYFKFAYMAANGAIAEAFKDEAKVHIFDFQITQGTQWLCLIEALAQRPGGPPSIRITTVDDPESQSSPVGGMKLVKQRLGKLAESLNVPFEFHAVRAKMSEVQASMIERRPDEALAVNFTLQLHHLPDESVCLTNPRDRLLRMAKSMNPKVLTLVEQEANTNTSPFFARFMETLDYYAAVFDSIDVALPRKSKDRVNVEEQCLARDIVNVIACEGAQRVERHELSGKWRARMMMAGFRPHPMSSHVNSTIKRLLETYSKNYRLKEEGGSLHLGWLNRCLVVASAWH